MKIGILTFHRALNYGAVLQCFALYKTLENMGHNVEVIDYRPEAIEKYRMIFRWKDFKSKNNIGKIKYITSSLLNIYSKKKTSKKFDKFLLSNIKFSCIVKNTEGLPTGYDVIFLGSDQIWSKEMCEGFDEIYYGQLGNISSKKIGYAASAGRMKDFHEADKIILFNYLSKIDKIGLREIEFQKFLNIEIGIKSSLVCDPVFLLNFSIFEHLTTKVKEKGYVLYYMLRPIFGGDSFAERLAHEKGLSILVVTGVSNPLKHNKYKTITDISPTEFLGYIKNADFIITDSFHVTSFSILMHKEFYTLRKTDNNERAETLLRIAGLEDRLINSNISNITSTCYDGVDERIKEFRNNSLSFIRTCL